MKKTSILLSAALLVCGTLAAQVADPVIMTINGQDVPRSEFEYSYNKNNTDGVIDKKSVEEYVPMFVDYKLKVCAAVDARLDTLSSFKQEFATYRDEQIRPAFVTDEDIEREARKIYKDTQTRIDTSGGLFQAKHILLLLKQKASEEEQRQAKQRIDSIYAALLAGTPFDTLAVRHSQDPGSARQGGLLPWLAKGQTLPDFEKVMMSLGVGETSKPFLSPAGYHIVTLVGKQNFFPYDSVRADIRQFIERQRVREYIVNEKLDSLAKQQGTTVAEVLAAKQKELEAKDSNVKYLIQEYHDGLLLYEMQNRTVWDKAAKDSVALESYFKAHKKKYKWKEKRYVERWGKKLRKPKDYKDVLPEVTADYQKELEQQWLDQLRKTYPVELRQDIIATVNKH